ncbi:MAG TPA: TolC family protein [Pirellulales bacterium]|jgi:outer membrane protein TolC|nr:TolC family protein [Pirellulales bacterium]
MIVRLRRVWLLLGPCLALAADSPAADAQQVRVAQPPVYRQNALPAAAAGQQSNSQPPGSQPPGSQQPGSQVQLMTATQASEPDFLPPVETLPAGKPNSEPSAGAPGSEPPAEGENTPRSMNAIGPTPDPNAPAILSQSNVASVDLPSVLALAGVQNPDLLIARQRVVEAAALRQLAAAQILPNLNLGMNYDDHTGALQQSSGRIIDVHRQSLYMGAGANAIAAGTVNIPGIQYNLNVSNAIFGFLTARQEIRTQQANTLATRNEVLLATCVAYVELLRAECRRAVSLQIRGEAAEVARLTAAYAQTGEGRKADADRAATELANRQTDTLAADGDVLLASARLAQVLNLDPSTRLHATDGWVVPAPIVPAPIPLNELIVTALLRRPELAAQRSAIQTALLNLQAARLLPFSPQMMVGFSSGGFGGGSNRQDLNAAALFSSFDARVDIDVVTYWTLQNMGLGNRAQIAAARARVGIRNYEQLAVLDRVRFEVASAFARVHARFAQIGSAENATRAAIDAFHEDLIRIRGREGLPIEVLDSLRLLGRARFDYLNAICDFNRAEFELYVALGQPPADMLARPVPEKLVPQPPAGAETTQPGPGVETMPTTEAPQHPIEPAP